MWRSVSLIFWTILLDLSTAIRVPPSWDDEQRFLPYYVVVDGLPSDQNIQTYYPAATSNDQIVQNDITVKLFQKMNPHVRVLKPAEALKVEKTNEGLHGSPNQFNQADYSTKKLIQKKQQQQQNQVNHEQPLRMHPGDKHRFDHEQYHPKPLLKPSKKDLNEIKEGLHFYDQQKQNFQRQPDEFPSTNGFYPSKGPPSAHQEEEDKAASLNFEPYRTYAQVRKSITKKRVPKKKKSDPRLKESIKDSKVHTVYTEEGYEDSGYDHGDQEKSTNSGEDSEDENEGKYAETREYKKENLDEDSDDQSGEFVAPKPPPPPTEDEQDFHDESSSENSEEESESKIEENHNSTSENQTQAEKPKFISAEKLEDSEELILIDSFMDETKYGKKISVKRPKRSTPIAVETQKYPLYNYKRLNQLSSLRYIENSDNVPIESMDTSFYEQADKQECPEVLDVDPVPEKIKEASENSTTSNNTSMPTPKVKLNKLGDQIDCLKSKYFGEEPLDNPLFTEDKIDTPKTIFKQDNQDNVVDYDEDNRFGKILEEDSRQNTTNDALPEAEAYIRRRLNRRPAPGYFEKTKKYMNRRRRRPKPPKREFPYPDSSERLSEVHYKDEIKPSEQMNVFADVINNIKNSSRDLGVDSSDLQPVSSIGGNIVEIRPSKREHYGPKTIVKAHSDYDTVEEILMRTTTVKSPSFYTTNGFSNNNRYRKYKRRRQTTTTQDPPQENQNEYAPVKKRGNINQDLQEDVGFKPMLDTKTFTNHKATHQEIDPNTLNRYYVIGMKPPPQKSFSHPNLYTPTHVKKRKIQYPNRRRFARSTRRGYSEIERAGQRVETTTTEKIEEDDYVPHRRRNFHYDEKTGKIVYDKSPQMDVVEEIEYEYVEVEEPTHPPPKTKQEIRRIWPSKFPDGPNYLDFVKKLKEDQTYVQILDPQPTEKVTETTTTSSTPIKSEDSTTLPEYLAILGQVRSNKDYKFIEDPVQKTKNVTSNFEKERVEFEVDIEDEELDEDVQNSPGAQVLNLKQEEDGVADIVDGSEGKIKNYKPRTGVDTSKYKSIERKPVTRHNISSKYSDEDTLVEEVESKVSSSSLSQISTTTSSESITIDIPTTSIPSTVPLETNSKSSGATPKIKSVLVGRRRGTTTSRVTTAESTTTSSITRRRGRNRFRSVTTERNNDQSTRSRRNLQWSRQGNLAVPSNHKIEYSETQDLLKLKPTPRTITLELIKQSEANHSAKKDNRTGNITTVNPDVEVFKDYDKDNKHGGNYKYRKLQIKVTRSGKPGVKEKDETLEIKADGYSDVIPKPFDYYTDPKLPMKVNRLKDKSVEEVLYEDIFADQTQNFHRGGDVNSEDLLGGDPELKPIYRSKKQNTDDASAFIKDPSQRLYYYAPI